MPVEVQLTLKSVRVFGRFSEPVFLDLIKAATRRVLREGESLFEPGQDDNNMYIVQEGEVSLFGTGGGVAGRFRDEAQLITTFGAGEHLSSLLGILDHLTGGESKIQSLEARANTNNTVVIELPFAAFRDTVDGHPEVFRHLLTVISAHLQRVSFVALYQFLGLTKDLISSPPAVGTPAGLENITVAGAQDRQQAAGILAAGLDAMATSLGLADASALREGARLLVTKPCEVVLREGSTAGGLYYVVSGKLETCLGEGHVGQDVLFVGGQGTFAGQLQCLSGMASFISLRTPEPCVMVHVPFQQMAAKLDAHHELASALVQQVMRLVSPLVRFVDFIIDWSELEAGEALYEQGDPSSCVYILLHGRIRSVREDYTGQRELIREYGRNDLLGEIEVLTNAPRATTTHAVRDSELAKIPAGLLHIVKQNHPQVMTHLIRSMGELALHAVEKPRKELQSSNLSSVCLIPVSDDVPLAEFAQQLVAALDHYGPARCLNRASVAAETGADPNSKHGDRYQLTGWLGEQEDLHDIVIYEAEPTATPWTQRCLRQADCVLIVGCGHSEPSVSSLEGMLETLASRAQKELVLLHRHTVHLPSRTAEWLNMRTWCSAHHHIQCPKGYINFPGDPLVESEEEEEEAAKEKEEHEDEAAVLRARETNIELTDFGRLARRLRGLSVALVLGGGGARGITQIGCIKALEEAGIPIDMIGGTSIGSFVGALYAEEKGYHGTNLRRRARSFAYRMDSTMVLALDLTYPAVSMLTGRAFNNCVRNTFGLDLQIEDLWIPYFAVSTDITMQQKAVHRSGPVWTYVRASMSLSGYLPPICDPVDGHMLLDGGYVDILPVSEVAPMRPNRIIGIDVGAKDSTDLDNFGDHLSGWWFLWKKLNPFTETPKIPDVQDIASRLAFISGTQQMKTNRQLLSYTYVRPPIDGYKTLDWAEFEGLEHLGYDFMHSKIDSWAEERPEHARQRASSPVGREVSGSRPRFDSLTSFDAPPASLTDWVRSKGGRE